jgi:hypothetical protein
MDDGSSDVAILRELQDEAEGDSIVYTAEEWEVDMVASVRDRLNRGFTTAMAAKAETTDCPAESSGLWE